MHEQEPKLFAEPRERKSRLPFRRKRDYLVYTEVVIEGEVHRLEVLTGKFANKEEAILAAEKKLEEKKKEK